MEINCPRCYQPMEFDRETDCEEAYNCTCGDGIIINYVCHKCNLTNEIIMDCKHESEDEK